MDATPRPEELEGPVDDVDRWYVHRHTLNPTAGTVLTGPATRLSLTPLAAGGLRADFELERGRDPIVLHRNLIGVESYRGSGEHHYARIVHVENRALGVHVLVGHVTAQSAPKFGVRDVFVASRDERAIRPKLGDQTFPAPMRLLLYDNLRHDTAGAIKLLPSARDASQFEIFLEGEPRGYEIEFHQLPSGGLEFRHSVRKGHTIGGLVLPSAREGQRLVLLCFRHLHDEHVHSTVPEPGGDPTGDVPGHPACTTVYAGDGPV